LAFRNYDIRDMQKQLAELSLSSLGRSEAHIMSSLIGVRNHISKQLEAPERDSEIDYITTSEGDELLESNTEQLLGLSKDGRRVRIMVTLSSAAADDYTLIKDLIVAGMDCARINCAHDTHEVW